MTQKEIEAERRQAFEASYRLWLAIKADANVTYADIELAWKEYVKARDMYLGLA